MTRRKVQHREAGSAAHGIATLAVPVAVGTAAALAAVGARWLLPLAPTQLPTLTVVVVVALCSTFSGLAAGISAAIVGGLLSWYLFFNPYSFAPSVEGFIPLIGFSVIAGTIITTAHLYRRSEQRNHQAELAALQKHAEDAELFAREMAHRLKNALAVVQSIAFQTLGETSADTAKFGARLKALADAHDLLSEHVERPTAGIADVVATALRPFSDDLDRVRITAVDTRIPSQQVVSLALVVHELATNAAKYGALSGRDGWIELVLNDVGDRIHLLWQEHDGPPVRAPDRQGFGTRLLKRVATEFDLRFEPTGLRCALYVRKG
jgi:two-component sensor histidine kinase